MRMSELEVRVHGGRGYIQFTWSLFI